MRLLIIEDNIKLANSLRRGLEQEGFAVDCLYDGKSGLNRIIVNREGYDLVILDLMLPEIDGITLCKEIRKNKIWLPLIMLTAKDTIQDKVAGLDCGADDYLVKPFSFSELMARIRALLRRPKEIVPARLKVKDLVLDTGTRKVMRKNKEIELTLKEFSLLEYLMRHTNQVLSREQILDHAWDFAFDSFSNVVDVHIKNLRKKIDKGFHERLLETIRGTGYRLKG